MNQTKRTRNEKIIADMQAQGHTYLGGSYGVNASFGRFNDNEVAREVKQLGLTESDVIVKIGTTSKACRKYRDLLIFKK